jgi:HEAT repeat protein
MAVSIEAVLAFLDQDEPEYREAVRLGPDALPHLARVVREEGPMRASKAAYLAGLIDGDESPAVLEQALRRDEPEVRVAAAYAVQHLSRAPPELFDRLLSDHDDGVRRTALKSISVSQPSGLTAKVEELASGDEVEHVRELARETARRLGR